MARLRTGMLLASALLAPLFVAAPAPVLAAAPLVADAGESKLVPVDGALAVAGRAFGGSPPYAFAWTFEGSSVRFLDPAAAATTFDADGLAPGDLTLTLTVTDGASASASDTVVHNVGRRDVIADLAASIGPGALGLFVRDEPFDVPAGYDRLTVTLSWNAVGSPTVSDLDLAVLDPSGAEVAAARSGARPEVAVAAPAPPGTWTARVEGALNVQLSYRISVLAETHPNIPVVVANNPWLFGALDAQTVRGSVTGGVAPTGGWDFDLHGTYEGTIEEATALLPVGTHTIAVKATDARGYEARREATLTVRDDVPHVRQLHCPSPAKIPSMEFGASNNTVCWNHHGHITFALGDAFVLLGGSGVIESNEIHFSPSADIDPATLSWLVHIETSLDGRAWTHLEPLHFNIRSLVIKQRLDLVLAPSDEPFRFIRFHQPPSANQEGLSGYLDQGRVDLLVDTAGATAGPTGLAEGARELACEHGDILEDFFALHPCTFGGVNRYDAASLYHTYIVADPGGPPAVLDEIGGSFLVAPWRTDDWFIPLVPPVEQVTSTKVFIDASVDGRTWKVIAAVPAEFAVPGAFEKTLDPPVPARYVRFVADKHPVYFSFADDDLAPLHHPEAFFVHTGLEIEGLLPE